MSDKYCILQDDLKDCGVCSLLSIIKYYNGNVSKEYLRELTKTDKSGVTALNIIKASRELGFESYGVKASLKDIKVDYLPLIAHITIDKKFNHFVVIYKIDKKKNQILVMDPAKGFVKISFSNFLSISTGYFLILKKKQIIPKLAENNDFFKDIKSLISNYKIVCIIIVIMSFIYILINIISSYNFKLLFDELNTILNNDLLIIFIILCFLIIFKLLINLFRNLLINNLNFIIDKNIVLKAFNHIINLPYLYYKNHTNGDLLTRINDLASIKELISNFFASIFVDLSLAIIVLVVMLKINISFTIIIIISLILYCIISIISNKSIKTDIRDSYEKSSIVNNYLVESLSSFETIKNLSLQNYICRNFQNKYNDFNNIKEKILKKYNIYDFLKNNILLISNLIVLYLGVLYLKSNSLTITLLITFITLSDYLISPIKNVLDLELLYQNSKESIRRIREIYNIPKENLLFDKNMTIKNLKGEIDIYNVSYSYNGSDNVINNLSLEIKEGEKVLIYGDSGCGKSTLIKLLIKYLDNNYSGDINIGGYDIKNINMISLRNNICYVSQNEYLYTESVYENITLGTKVNYSKFLNISKNMHIDEIVNKSNLRYNYLIENNGENISGGEKMRIIIARSILKKANIYIYDESFSSLDIQLEKEILEYLFKIYKDKTFIIVSHRKSNIDLFDKTINLGDKNEKNREFI